MDVKSMLITSLESMEYVSLPVDRRLEAMDDYRRETTTALAATLQRNRHALLT